MLTLEATADRLIRDVLKKYSLKKTLYLSFEDCTVKVISNSDRLIELLKKYFRDFSVRPKKFDIQIAAIEGKPPEFGFEFVLKDPEPGKNKIKEEFVELTDGRIIRKRLTKMEFLFNRELNIAIGPSCANANQIVNFINNRYIEWRLNQGALLLHAAGIQVQGHGLALCGFSGMGKSTLALQLMRARANFVSNDRLIVQEKSRRLMMYGVAKWPRVNPGTLLNNPALQSVLSARERARFEKLTTEELWGLEHKFDVDVSRIFGKERFVLSSELDVLVILNWKREGGPMSFEPVVLENRSDLWPAFMKDTGLFFQPKRPDYFSEYASPDAYIDYLHSCRIYELSGGVDFVKAVRAITALWK